MDQTLSALREKLAVIELQYQWARWAFSTCNRKGNVRLLIYQHEKFKQIAAQRAALMETIKMAEEQQTLQGVQIHRLIGMPTTTDAATGTVTIHFPKSIQK